MVIALLAGSALVIVPVALWRLFWFVAAIWIAPWDLPPWAQRLFRRS